MKNIVMSFAMFMFTVSVIAQPAATQPTTQPTTQASADQVAFEKVYQSKSQGTAKDAMMYMFASTLKGDAQALDQVTIAKTKNGQLFKKVIMGMATMQKYSAALKAKMDQKYGEGSFDENIKLNVLDSLPQLSNLQIEVDGDAGVVIDQSNGEKTYLKKIAGKWFVDMDAQVKKDPKFNNPMRIQQLSQAVDIIAIRTDIIKGLVRNFDKFASAKGIAGSFRIQQQLRIGRYIQSRQNAGASGPSTQPKK